MSGEETLFQSQMALWDPESSWWSSKVIKRKKWPIVEILGIFAFTAAIISLILFANHEHQKLKIMQANKTEMTFNKTNQLLKKFSEVVKEKVKELQVNFIKLNDSLDMVENEQQMNYLKFQGLDGTIIDLSKAIAAQNSSLIEFMRVLMENYAKSQTALEEKLNAANNQFNGVISTIAEDIHDNSKHIEDLDEEMAQHLNVSENHLADLKSQIQTTNVEMDITDGNITQKIKSIEEKLDSLQFNQSITSSNWVDLESQVLSTEVKVAAMDSKVKSIEAAQNGINDKVQKLNLTMHTKIKENESGSLFKSVGSFGRYYKFPDKKTYSEGQAVCAKLGSHIVEFTNQNFRDKLIALLNEFPTEPFFIGMTDEEIEGEWKFANSKEIFRVENAWNQGEPNNIQFEHCVQVIKGIGLLNDVKCSAKFAILCEKDLVL